MEAQKLQVSEHDLDVAYEGAALHANRFFVSVGPTVRIAFAEQNGPKEKVFFRSAVSLSQQDAVALTRVLTDMVKPFEGQLEAKGSPTASAFGHRRSVLTSLPSFL